MGTGCSKGVQSGYARMKPSTSHHQTPMDGLPVEQISLSRSQYSSIVSEECSRNEERMDVELDEVQLLPNKDEDTLLRQYSSYFKYDQPEMVRLKERRFFAPVTVTSPYVKYLTDRESRSEEVAPISLRQSEEFDIINRNYADDSEEGSGENVVQRTKSLIHMPYSEAPSVQQLSQNLNELAKRSNMDLVSVSDKHELIPVVSDFIEGLLRNSELHLQTERLSNCSISMLQLCVNKQHAFNNNINIVTDSTRGTSIGPMDSIDNIQRYELLL